MIRDRAVVQGATTSEPQVYNALSFGWQGGAKTWSVTNHVALILAGLSHRWYLSVHTIVSMDFATFGCSGMAHDIFPPYFVAGAIFSGFAMVLTLLLITPVVFKLED